MVPFFELQPEDGTGKAGVGKTMRLFAYIQWVNSYWLENAYDSYENGFVTAWGAVCFYGFLIVPLTMAMDMPMMAAFIQSVALWGGIVSLIAIFLYPRKRTWHKKT